MLYGLLWTNILFKSYNVSENLKETIGLRYMRKNSYLLRERSWDNKAWKKGIEDQCDGLKMSDLDDTRDHIRPSITRLKGPFESSVWW